MKRDDEQATAKPPGHTLPPSGTENRDWVAATPVAHRDADRTLDALVPLGMFIRCDMDPLDAEMPGGDVEGDPATWPAWTDAWTFAPTADDASARRLF